MGSTFIASRCAKIDTVGTNVLIRGNMPLLGTDLHYAAREIQEASGVTDFLQRRIIDVPIIDNVGEREQFSAIMKAFGVNPSKFPMNFWPWWGEKAYDPNSFHGTTLSCEGHFGPGAVVWRPFEGLPAGGPVHEFLDKPYWDFSGFIDNIIHMLGMVKNAAVYVHCQLGADRTGAFDIGYRMKTRNLKFSEALAQASAATSAGKPNADYIRLSEAYAQALGLS